MTALVRFAARDPGGANVLAGFLLKAAATRVFPFDIWTLPRATPIFERADFATREFPERCESAEMEVAWKSSPAAMLLTGTSHYEPFEPMLWEIARRNSCPSFAINDSWVNLPSRFEKGRPDFVSAVDNEQVNDLRAIGFSREQIVLTGHPWLSPLIERREELIANTRVPVRADGLHVLFVSERIAADVAEGVNAPFGFDEFDSFTVVHRAACEAARAGLKVTLAIKFHPYEDPTEFLRRADALKQVAGLTVLPLERGEKPHRWILWSDLVVGIGSMLLLEAIVLGKPVVSIQPGLIREDTFIASRLGFAQALVDPTLGEKELFRLFSDQAARSAEAIRQRGFLKNISIDPVSRILDWIQTHGKDSNH